MRRRHMTLLALVAASWLALAGIALVASMALKNNCEPTATKLSGLEAWLPGHMSDTSDTPEPLVFHSSRPC